MAQYLKPNPVLTKGFDGAVWTDQSQAMTVEGAVNKTIVLSMLLLVGAVAGWMVGDVGLTLALPAILGAFVLSIFVQRKPAMAQGLAIGFAVLEGFAVGAISHAYESADSLSNTRDSYGSGIVLTAVGLTIGILVAMLALYRSGLIRVTEKLRSGIMVATTGVMLFYGVAIVVRLFGGDMPILDDAGAIGIGFSVLVVGLASANLLLNFDFIEKAAARQVPKHYEWVAAVGIIATLVWLYLELLRLLARLQRR